MKIKRGDTKARINQKYVESIRRLIEIGQLSPEREAEAVELSEKILTVTSAGYANNCTILYQFAEVEGDWHSDWVEKIDQKEKQ